MMRSNSPNHEPSRSMKQAYSVRVANLILETKASKSLLSHGASWRVPSKGSVRISKLSCREIRWQKAEAYQRVDDDIDGTVAVPTRVVHDYKFTAVLVLQDALTRRCRVSNRALGWIVLTHLQRVDET